MSAIRNSQGASGVNLGSKRSARVPKILSQGDFVREISAGWRFHVRSMSDAFTICLTCGSHADMSSGRPWDGVWQISLFSPLNLSRREARWRGNS